ncbi:MarR family winged helix-turn-helix transcriptional regulator [Streptomyces sp. NPDC058193]|uniref:MarR family winged helix-turn-helix transcriptional regulator n=1 Tax=Streptomyces sp. NPDC058193 TaxID=3346373 RepID=UPI0036EA3330
MSETHERGIRERGTQERATQERGTHHGGAAVGTAGPVPRPHGLLGLPSYLAGHAARIGHDALVQAVGQNGLRLPHFATLTALADFGPLPQHVLAERLGFQRSHLGGYLDTVEERGLVCRARDKADRRRQVVALTEEGAELQRRLLVVAEESQETFLACLTPVERELFTELLRRLVDADDRTRSQADGPRGA